MKKNMPKEIHISKIIAKKRIWCDKAGHYEDEYIYFEWLLNHKSGYGYPIVDGDYYLKGVRKKITVSQMLIKANIPKEFIGLLSRLVVDFGHPIDKIINIFNQK